MLLVVLVACGGDPTPPTIQQREPAPTGRPEPDDEPSGIARTGDIADVVVTEHLPWLEETGSRSISALVGPDLGPAVLPASCALDEGLCAAATPFEVDAPPVVVRPPRSTWLGDTLRLGEHVLSFVTVPEARLGGYRRALDDDALLDAPLDLEITDGEWNEGTLPGAIVLPPALTGLEPDPALPVLVGDAVTTAFQWAPGAEDTELWLTVQGPGVALTRRLVDDGEAFVDLRGIRYTEPVHVTLWRVRTTETSWNGNTVRAHGASAQQWCVIDACDGPPVDAWPFRFAFTFTWSGADPADAQWTLFADGTWRAGLTSRGTWVYDCCTRTLTMRFTSGTAYTGTVGADGCIDGTMQSWNGGVGTWSGCL